LRAARFIPKIEKGAKTLNTGKILYFFLCLSFLAMTVAPGALAQPGDDIQSLKKEIEALRKDQKELRKDLDALKKRAGGRIPPLRRRLPPPQSVVISVEGEPYKGKKNAKITLVEFSDYQCPYCARHVKNTLPRLDKEYIQTGKLKYVFRDFPILQLHPQAPKVHEAANCAGRQNKYWQIHDIFFRNRKFLPVPKLKEFARTLGLDMAKFNKCLDSGEEAAEVRSDQADGRKAFVRGTPTFFLGYTPPSGKDFRSVNRIIGAQPYSRFKAAIDALLAKIK
jgi:protein-disulfide isomerase